MMLLLLWLLFAPPTKQVTVQVPCDSSDATVTVSDIVLHRGQGVVIRFQPISGVPPFTFIPVSVPTGFTLTTEGTLSGTAASSGTYPYTIECRDANAYQ